MTGSLEGHDAATPPARDGWSLMAIAGATETVWLMFLAWLAWQA
jgi:hypothetical protein